MASQKPPNFRDLLRSGMEEASNKPVAIVLAGHNGSGKSTLWEKRLADELRMPLVNADRMMLSLLPPRTPATF